MTTLTPGSQAGLKSTRTQAHPFCLVCSQSNPLGLGLEFTVHDDGSVSTSFLGHSALEGFQGFLHGGMIASLLDGAMTNCLFAHGHVAMTGELKVRYREPVVIGVENAHPRLDYAVPVAASRARGGIEARGLHPDRKSTRLNS